MWEIEIPQTVNVTGAEYSTVTVDSKVTVLDFSAHAQYEFAWHMLKSPETSHRPTYAQNLGNESSTNICSKARKRVIDQHMLKSPETSHRPTYAQKLGNESSTDAPHASSPPLTCLICSALILPAPKLPSCTSLCSKRAATWESIPLRHMQ